MNNDKRLPVHIVPIGGIYVTDKPMIIQTVLGSCISLTAYDYKKKAGGMNHIMLPGEFDERNSEQMIAGRDSKYGIYAIDELLFRMEQLGCCRKNTEYRLFGASYLGKSNLIVDVPKLNTDFAYAYLSMLKLELTEELVHQNEALKILLNTITGNVKVVRLHPI